MAEVFAIGVGGGVDETTLDAIASEPDEDNFKLIVRAPGKPDDSVRQILTGDHPEHSAAAPQESPAHTTGPCCRAPAART